MWDLKKDIYKKWKFKHVMQLDQKKGETKNNNTTL